MHPTYSGKQPAKQMLGCRHCIGCTRTSRTRSARGLSLWPGLRRVWCQWQRWWLPRCPTWSSSRCGAWLPPAAQVQPRILGIASGLFHHGEALGIGVSRQLRRCDVGKDGEGPARAAAAQHADISLAGFTILCSTHGRLRRRQRHTLCLVMRAQSQAQAREGAPQASKGAQPCHAQRCTAARHAAACH